MLTAKHIIEFKTGKRTAKTIVKAGTAEPQHLGRLPRITKIMALAIRLDHLIKSGQVTDQAELARVGNVTRARLTQIMNLLYLAPDIQEAVLLMQVTVTSETNVRESDLRAIAATMSWTIQLEQWLAFQNLDQAVQLNVGS